MTRYAFWALACAVLVGGGSLEAAPITISGDGALGDFSATLTYSSTDDSNATLTVAITNESTTLPGGDLSAFAFNNPGNNISGVTLSSTTGQVPPYMVIGGPGFQDGIMASPLDNFDIGASVTNQWLGGGSPEPGLDPGQSATFVFTFTGSNLDTLSEQSFIDESVIRQGIEHFFIVRFRGFDNGGSDKVSGGVPGDPGNPGGPVDPVGPTDPGGPVVPEPTSLALWGLAGLGMAFAARRKRFQQQNKA